MSFRIEQKILLSYTEAHQIYSQFKSEGMESLFPRRVINSLYFENRSSAIYRDSEEGCVPRKKIRIRSYDGDDSNFFEVKTSSFEGRFKASEFIDNQEVQKYSKFGLFDSLYGYCMPVLEVNYSRDYFRYKGIRVTIDRDISYREFNSSRRLRDKNCVLEFKAAAGTPLDFLAGLTPTPTSRFSKYSRGYELLID